MINTYLLVVIAIWYFVCAHNQKSPEKADLPEKLEKYPGSQGKHVASSWRMLPDPPIEIIESLTIRIVFSAMILIRSTSTAIALDLL
jgi:hypothetical protein